jgi:hypothetical protein
MHRDKIKVWARLDKLYAPKGMGAWRDGSVVSYEIKKDCGGVPSLFSSLLL